MWANSGLVERIQLLLSDLDGRRRPAPKLASESVHQPLSKAGSKIMIKHILAAAVIVPFLTVSGMAQDVPLVSKHIYVGGPASNIPHTTRQLSAYQAYAMAPKSSVRHAYRGGPNTVVVHGDGK